MEFFFTVVRSLQNKVKDVFIGIDQRTSRLFILLLITTNKKDFQRLKDNNCDTQKKFNISQANIKIWMKFYKIYRGRL